MFFTLSYNHPPLTQNRVMEALDKGNTSCVMKSEDKINQSKYFVTLVSYVLKLISKLEKDRNVIRKISLTFYRNKEHEWL